MKTLLQIQRHTNQFMASEQWAEGGCGTLILLWLASSPLSPLFLDRISKEFLTQEVEHEGSAGVRDDLLTTYASEALRTG